MDWNTQKALRSDFGPGELGASISASTLKFALRSGWVKALGASTPSQAVQMVYAGLQAIYVSGWQVAADVNGDMYPDLSLYPCNAVPNLVKSINNAFWRQAQIEAMEGVSRNWNVPIIADGEAGFGGALNAYEITKKLIEAGAAAVHFEDQLSSEKKCGHMGGKVLAPISDFLKKLRAARLASDVAMTNTVIIARTDAESAKLLSGVPSEIDKPFVTGTTEDGFYRITGGVELAIKRGLAYAPHADMLWMETSTPDLAVAEHFATEIHKSFPGKWLAYNLSPSFNWNKHLQPEDIAVFQQRLADLGYKFQFVTLAGFHSLNFAMYKLAMDFNVRGMSAYAELQKQELAEPGFKAVTHQKYVGAGYFDKLNEIISGGSVETTALKDSTEEQQF